ncbi:unnamed protein product, partial [Rotaria sordida]
YRRLRVHLNLRLRLLRPDRAFDLEKK